MRHASTGRAPISLLILALAMLPATLAGQEPAPFPPADELLNQTVAHHDPDQVWSSRPLEITVETRYGERLAQARGHAARRDRIRLGNAGGPFAYWSQRGGDRIEIFAEGGSFGARLNGSSKIGVADREKHRLRVEQLPSWRDYFAYVYGLPMKLRDPGTRLDPRAKRTVFDGRDMLALRVTYDPEVGNDTWYFYLDPGTLALAGCRFFHDESANDGEYIVFDGEVEGPRGLRLPRQHHWYTNRDGEHLATDEVKSIRSAE